MKYFYLIYKETEMQVANTIGNGDSGRSLWNIMVMVLGSSRFIASLMSMWLRVFLRFQILDSDYLCELSFMAAPVIHVTPKANTVV